MFKYVALLALVAIAVAAPAPEPKPLVVANPYLAAPVVSPIAPAVVTAQSSQVIARNYNTLAAPLVAAAPAYATPFAAPLVNPYVAAPAVAAPFGAPTYVF